MDGRISEVSYSHPRYASVRSGYAGKYARVRYAVRSSTLPYFNFFLTGTVPSSVCPV